jgi:hypothetical protein
MRRVPAVLASTALHGAVVLALLGLRFAGEPGVLSSAEIVRVELVSLRPDAAPQNQTPAPSSDSPAPSDAPAPPSDSPRTVPDAAENAVVAEPNPAPATQEAPPEAGPESAPTPEAEPKLAAEPEQRVETEPLELPEAQVATFAEPPSPSPQTVAIDAAQFEMLDRRVTELAARMELVTDREVVEWRHRGQAYSATLERMPAADNMGMDELKVTVSTEQDGQRLSTQLGMRRLAFSSFAQFVDRWDPNVQIHDDEIDGRFHSNTEIAIGNDDGVQPVFRGKVTTGQRINTSNSERHVRRDEVFLGGLETGAPRIWLPQRSLPSPDARRDAQVHELTKDARITFYADGSYGWTYVETAEPEKRTLLGSEPHYVVAAEKAIVYVKGIVNGKVLVYSPRRIVIEDDLVYAAHPAFPPDSDDYLGLVSEGSVEIAAPESTGPGDVTVHAAIFAKRSFAVRSYGTRGLATLRVYGSVAAGWITATEPRFRTKLEFDDRLASLRPPSFPLTDRYELAAWDGRWILDPE